ncbi:cytochrome P450 89A2-like [Triticum dicoccoides]|uniref:cytochrome P450 89A2-like n=1 Tax=Triticum dicoccoides TaxID=85692 RepID=UPI0018919245|nr:cytochrome P450 89A2-like [Triticum dicoccoides]
MESLLSVLAYASFFFLVLAVFRRICRVPARVIPQPIIEISDAAVTRRALVEYADAFSNRPMSMFRIPIVKGHRRRRSDNIISVPYGPLWRTLRCNLAAETIHPTRYASYAPLRRAAIDDIVASVQSAASKGRAVVVRDSLYAAVFSMIARMCFGEGLVDEADVRVMQCEFREFILAAVESTSTCESKLLGYWRRRQRDPIALRRRLAELFLPLIEEARRQSSRFCDGHARSYVDSLIRLRVPDEDDDNDEHLRRALTEDEMVSLVLEFLGAGTETVVACVECTLAHLVTRPEIQNKLRREAIINIKYDGDNKYPSESEDEEREILHRGMAPYLHAVVLESLRMHPPTPFVMRDIRAEGGVVRQTAMPAGGLRVHFVLGDIGRDPKTWTDPDEFRPERFLAGGEGEAVGPLPGPKEIKMMPFGAGRRYCPGMALGMLNVKCLLAALVREFEWTEGNCGVDLTELDGFFKAMKKPLRARVTPHTCMQQM